MLFTDIQTRHAAITVKTALVYRSVFIVSPALVAVRPEPNSCPTGPGFQRAKLVPARMRTHHIGVSVTSSDELGIQQRLVRKKYIRISAATRVAHSKSVFDDRDALVGNQLGEEDDRFGTDVLDSKEFASHRTTAFSKRYAVGHIQRWLDAPKGNPADSADIEDVIAAPLDADDVTRLA
jgi:hypothetical protein